MGVAIRDRGVGAVGVVACLLVVVVVAGAGWYVMGRQKQGSSTAVQQSETKQPAASPVPKAVDHTEGGTYLVIKEWGVRFPLPAELKGKVSYAIRGGSSTIGPNNLPGETARLEIKPLTDMAASDCDFASADNTFGGPYIVRTSVERDKGTVPYDFKSDIRIGDYYYSVGRTKYSEQCVKDEAKFQEAGDTIGSLVQALDELEAIPRQ